MKKILKTLASVLLAIAVIAITSCPTPVELSTNAEISNFLFEASGNSALSVDIIAAINETNITAAVPYGTNVTALVPTVIISTGAVSNKVSGTAQDFSSPVVYTITAEDGVTTIDYTVTVTISADTSDTTAPGDVTGLSAAPGNSLVNLSWTDPSDTDLQYIEITYTPDGSTPSSINAGVESFQVIGLTNDTEYTFTAIAVDASGNRAAGVNTTGTPIAINDTTPPVINSIIHAPAPAIVDIPVTITVDTTDPESAVTVTYDTDLDGVYDNTNQVTYSTTGLKTVNIKATSIGGDTLDSHDILVNPPALYSGNYTIDGTDTQGDLDGLAGYTGIDGNLIISSTALTTFSGTNLENITEVTGYIRICVNNLISNLSGLDNLASIGGDLYIGHSSYGGNNIITSLEGLNNLISLTGSLYIYGNGNLLDITALSGLSSAGRVDIESNALLSSLNGLHNLDCTAVIDIQNNGQLADISALTNVTSYGVNILNNDMLTTLAGLESVSGLNTGHIDIGDNQSLNDISALSGVTMLTGHLNIYNNDSLPSLNGLSMTNNVGLYISISSNAQLTDISALSGITILSSYLTISDNPQLSSLNGVENMFSISGAITISGNSSLTDVSHINASSAGSHLSITNNDALQDFTGIGPNSGLNINNLSGSFSVSGNLMLGNFDGLSIGSIGGSISIYDNTNLTSISTLSSIANLSGGSISIYDNLSLPNLTGLENISTTTAVSIYSNTSLNNISALADTTINGTFRIYSNQSLLTLTGLSDITISGGGLDIGYYYVGLGNPNLANLDGLSTLKLINSYLSIYGNTSLSDITALNTFIGDTSSVNSVLIENNDALVSLSGLESIRSIGGLTIRGNNILTDMTAFSDDTDGYSITSLGSLYIEDNNALPNLDGLNNIISINGNVSFSNNDQMTTLSHMGSLGSLLTTTGTFTISDNAILVCTDLTKLTSIGSSSALSIYNNASLSTLVGPLPGGDGLDSLTTAGSIYIPVNDPPLAQTEIDELNTQLGL